jgi:hypothetical protein
MANSSNKRTARVTPVNPGGVRPSPAEKLDEAFKACTNAIAAYAASKEYLFATFKRYGHSSMVVTVYYETSDLALPIGTPELSHLDLALAEKVLELRKKHRLRGKFTVARVAIPVRRHPVIMSHMLPHIRKRFLREEG